MKHDAASSNSMFEPSDQAIESTAISPIKANGRAIGRTNPSMALTPVKAFDTSQTATERTEASTGRIVDHFLPVPNRWLIFGSLGLISLLGLSSIVLTALPQRTAIKVKAKVQPTTEPQVLQSGSGGIVKSIFVQNYESLSPEQVIAAFEKPNLYTELSNLQASITQTKKQLSHLQGEIADLQQRQVSGRWLSFQVSQSQFNYSRNLLLNHQDELQQKLSDQEKQLASVKQQVDNMNIQAPVAGTLYDLQIKNVGQTIEANKPIAKIMPEGTALEVKALVSEAEANNVKVGMSAQINLNICEFSNFGILEGEVKSVELVTPQLAESFSNTSGSGKNLNKHMVTVETKANPSRPGAKTCKLLPGAEGDISIISKQERTLTLFLRKLGFSNNV